MATDTSGGGFQRDLSEEEMAEVLQAGGKMAASMRHVLATVSEKMARLQDVNQTLQAKGSALRGEQRSAVSASLNAVSGSLNALQASLKVIGGAVSETTTSLAK